MALNKKEISMNVAYAMLAQVISLFLSILMSLFVPKILGVKEFGYWQLFIFYTSYSGMLPLGLYDGLYLRLGGKVYNRLNHEIIGTQFHMSVLLQAVILAVIASCGISLGDKNRGFVIVASCAMALISNIAGFVGLILQAVNKTKIYSMSVIINRITFIAILLMLLLNVEKNFSYYILGYIMAQCIATAYCIFKANKIIFSKNVFCRRIVKLYIGNMKIGWILTFANIASIFIIGIGRFFIDDEWGVETFGKVSFALTMTHFVLIFVNQVGLVLFPALRRCDTNEIQRFYRNSRKAMITFLPASFIMVYPLMWFINIWLPNYVESIPYFFLMIPLCIYDGQMQMIGYTMLKVLRKERILLYINLIAVCISGLLCIVSVYVFHNVTATIASVSIAVIVRAIITDIYFAKLYSLRIYSSLLTEFVFVILFIATNLICHWNVSLIAFIATYTFYLFLNKYKIKY